MVDFRTETQKKREVRNTSLISEYKTLIESEGAHPNGVYRILSKHYGLTISGVIGILRRYAKEELR